MFCCLKIVQDLQRMCVVLSNKSPCELDINQNHDILNQYFQNQMARTRFWDSYLGLHWVFRSASFKNGDFSKNRKADTQTLKTRAFRSMCLNSEKQGIYHHRQNTFSFVSYVIFHGFSLKILFSFPLHWRT